jgi:Rnl2 family RNA ligase
MDFCRFPSIINHTHMKDISWWVQNTLGLHQETYLLTEKLHGANIQFTFSPDGTFQVCSRNRVLSMDEGFHGIWDTMFDYLEILGSMKKLAKKDGVLIRLFGEFFGSNIQKGVKYGPKKHIRFFALMKGEFFLTPEQFDSLIPQDFRSPEIIKIRGLAGAIEYACEFESPMARILGVDPDPENVMEGVVIMPYRNVFYKGDAIFWLKKKNPKFFEHWGHKELKPQQDGSPMMLAFIDAFRSFINDNRVDSVFSKEGPIENQKQIGKYIKLIVADAQEDFGKENEEFTKLTASEQKRIMGAAGAQAAALLKARL